MIEYQQKLSFKAVVVLTILGMVVFISMLLIIYILGEYILIKL